MTSRGQCPRGGGACECPRVGAFFKLMTSRGQCPRGGGAPGVPPIQVQTPPTWLAGYGPDSNRPGLQLQSGTEQSLVTHQGDVDSGGCSSAVVGYRR